MLPHGNKCNYVYFCTFYLGLFMIQIQKVMNKHDLNAFISFPFFTLLC